MQTFVKYQYLQRNCNHHFKGIEEVNKKDEEINKIFNLFILGIK